MYENGSMVALIFGKVNAKAPPAEEEFQGSRKVLWSNNPVSERWKITEEQYARIKDCLPVQRANASLSNLQFLNAGCMWLSTVQVAWTNGPQAIRKPARRMDYQNSVLYLNGPSHCRAASYRWNLQLPWGDAGPNPTFAYLK